MTTWRSGMRLTSDRLNDNTLRMSTTTGATAGTGFTLVSFSGRKVNGITTIQIICSRSGASIPQSGVDTGDLNPDINMATLPAGWRPPETIQAMWNSSVCDGGSTISTAGVVQLQTVSGNSGIANGHAPRVYASWISENN